MGLPGSFVAISNLARVHLGISHIMWNVSGDARYGMSCHGEIVRDLCEKLMRYSRDFSGPFAKGSSLSESKSPLYVHRSSTEAPASEGKGRRARDEQGKTVSAETKAVAVGREDHRKTRARNVAAAVTRGGYCEQEGTASFRARTSLDHLQGVLVRGDILGGRVDFILLGALRHGVVHELHLRHGGLARGLGHRA